MKAFVGSSVLVAALAAALLGGGPATGVAVDAPDRSDTPDREEAARSDFDHKLYRKCLDRLDAWEKADGSLPFEMELLQVRAQIRLSLLDPEARPDEHDIDRFLDLLEEGDFDETRARAARDLFALRRYGRQSNRIQSLLAQTRQLWESNLEPERVLPDYRDYFEAALRDQPHYGTRGSDLAQMWKNLVAGGMDREDTLRLARFVFYGENPPPAGSYGRFPRPSGDALGVVVARTLLAMPTPGDLEVPARLILANDAESHQDVRTAIAHLEWLNERRITLPVAIREHVEKRLHDWRSSQASLSGPDRYRPGSQHVVDVSWRNARRWTLTVEQLRPLEDVKLPADEHSDGIPTSWQNLTALYSSSAGHEVFRRDFEDRREARARRGEIQDQPHLSHSQRVWIDPLPKGLYRVRIQTVGYEDQGARDEYLLQVSTLGMRLSALGDQVEDSWHPHVWIVDTASGRSIAGARGVAIAYDMDPSERRERRSYHAQQTGFSSDADGMADLASADVPRSMGIAVVAEFKGEPVIGFQRGRVVLATLGTRVRHSGFVWTDRPVYRPGETVHAQIAWRSLHDLARTVEASRGMQLVVDVRDPQRDAIYHTEVTLDDNGTADVEFPLDDDPRLGAYTVEVRGGNPESVAMTTLQVEEVRWPEFEVKVGVDTGFRPVLGDSIDVVVDASYLFGGPVEGRVAIDVSRRPHWWYWQPRRDWGIAPPVDRIRPVPSPGRRSTVSHQELPLDAEGHARLRIPTEDSHGGAGWEYVIQATVTDQARRSEQGVASVSLGHEALRTYLHAARNVVPPKENFAVSVHVEDNLGQTSVVHGEWTLVRRTEKRWETVRSDSLATDGAGDATLDLRVERAGIYRLSFVVDDGRGSMAQATTDFWCAGPNVRTLEGFDEGLQIMATEPSFSGDVAQLLLLSDAPGTDVLLTHGFAGGASAEVIHMNGTAQWIEIPLSARHRPHFEVEALRAHALQWTSARLQVNCPSADRTLKLELSFGEKVARPGSTTPLELIAHDAQGNPVQTVFAVAVVDDAVLQVRPRSNPDAVRNFARFRTTRLPSSRELTTPRGGKISDLSREDRNEELEREATSDAVRAPTAGRAYPKAEAASTLVEDFADFSSSRQLPLEVPKAVSQGPEIQVRQDFRSTALWQTGVRTDAQGRATLEVPLASTLTRWNAFVAALDPQSRVGNAEAELQTRLPLMVQLEHPRVLRERDEVSLAALVHNDTDRDAEVRVSLVAPDLQLDHPVRTVKVRAHGQARVEWEATVPEHSAKTVLRRDDQGRPLDAVPATTRIAVRAETATGGDAVTHDVPLYPAGTPLRILAHAFFERLETAPSNPRHTSLDFELPSDRLPGSDLVLAHVTPSVLGGCVQALPYLAEFPQGCTEQTLSRFVPAVAVCAVAQRLGFDPKRVDPELDRKISKGLARIRGLQNSSGAWPWWEGGPDNLYMTAYAVRSLALAHEYGVTQTADLLQRGRQRLEAMYAGTERLDDRAYVLHALALAARQLDQSWAWDPQSKLVHSLDLLFEQRDKLSAGSRALLAMTEEYRGNHDRAVEYVRHLGNDLHRLEDGSIYWGQRQTWWRGQNAVEATAFVLEALTTVDPQSPWRDGAARWLMLNREGRRWHSTRETAHAVLSLVRYVGTQEARESMEGRVVFRSGDREIGHLQLNLDAVLGGRLTAVLDPVDLSDGANHVTVELEGTGPLWVTLEANCFTRQRKIDASAGDLEISRQLFELQPIRTLGGWIAQKEVPLETASLQSGERVRVKLGLHALHDLDFVRIFDPRAAGLESLERLSGPYSRGGLWARRELGSERTEFYVDHLPAGDHEIIYDLVVERPGRYHAEPARMDGMYLPMRAAHSSSFDVEIEP